MIKKQEYPRRDNNQSNNNVNNQGSSNTNYVQKGPQEHPLRRENPNSGNRNFQRDTAPRQNYQYQNSAPRYVSNRVKSVETVEDIKADISRIEKEIELEIKEIKSMRLGM